MKGTSTRAMPPAHWLRVCGCLVVGKPDVFWARIRGHGSK